MSSYNCINYTVYTRFIHLLDQYLLWGWFALSASTPEFAMPVWCLPRHYSTKQQHATGAWVEHPVKGRTERLIFSYAQSMSRLLQFRMDVWISERYKLPEPWRMLRLIHESVGLHHFIILLSHKLVSFRLRTLQQRFPHSIPTMHLHLGGLGMIRRQWPVSPSIEVADKKNSRGFDSNTLQRVVE